MLIFLLLADIINISAEGSEAMEHGQQAIDLMIIPTQRCNRNCWFCEDDSGCNGDELDIHNFWHMVDVLFSDNRFNNGLIMRRVIITGGGEPLLYPDFPELFVGTTMLLPDSILIRTSGLSECSKEKTIFTEFLQRVDDFYQGIAHFKEEAFEVLGSELRVAVSVYNHPQSFERLKRTLDAGISEIEVHYRQDPRRSDYEQFFEFVDFWNMLENWGFVKTFSSFVGAEEWLLEFADEFVYPSCPEDGWESLEYETTNIWYNHFTKQSIVVIPFEDINARGRAEKDIGDWIRNKNQNKHRYSLCPLFNKDFDSIQIGMDENGKIGICHCGNNYNCDPENIWDFIEEYPRIRQEIFSMLMDIGRNDTIHPCDICPLCKHKPNIIDSQKQEKINKIIDPRQERRGFYICILNVVVL